jgi:hypothetical protein
VSAGNFVRRPRVAALIVVALSVVVALAAGVAAAMGASVTSVVVTGGAGTATVGGALHAKKDGVVTLTVRTSSDTQCVEIRGAHTAMQGSVRAKSEWTFTFTAGDGDGLKTMSVEPRPNFNNSNNNCSGRTDARQTSYVLDNTGPVVTGQVNPAANAAGWSNRDVAVTWAAEDASGVTSGPTPASDEQTSPTAGVEKTASATDAVGNTGTGRLTVKLDKTAPSIDGTRSPARTRPAGTDGRQRRLHVRGRPVGHQELHRAAGTVTWPPRR